MEAQSFGVALSYGGPFCGVIAAKEQFLRQMPGRLVGQTVDGDGQPRICADAVDARAAYPAGEGDFEHLHESGAGGADGDDLPDRVWEGRDSRTGRAQSGQGGVCSEDVERAAGSEAAVHGRAAVPRIRFADAGSARAVEPAAAGRTRLWAGWSWAAGIRSWGTRRCGARRSW